MGIEEGSVFVRENVLWNAKPVNDIVTNEISYNSSTSLLQSYYLDPLSVTF